MIVADNETAVDLLYYEAIAKTVVRLVREKSDEPLSVGVHGDWGAGKSSVLMMVDEAFSNDDRVLCVRFNGWLFQGFEDAKAVLIETIVEELRRKRPMSQKVAEQAKKVLRRVDWMKLARKAGVYGFTLSTGMPHPETIKDLGAAARSLISKGTEDVSPETVAALVEGSDELLREVAANSAPEQMHAFRQEFAELLKDAEIDRLIVLVDDLDRCLPDTAIETLEAIRLFLFVPRAAFVIAADEGMIEYAVRQHFPDLPVATGPATYARNYLEKLIQVPFRLPSLGYAETRIYVTLLLVLNACGEEADEFQKLTGLARELLRRPWKGPGLDRKAVEKALGGVPVEIERAMELAGRIAPILADGARGNPRQIKRFINTMMLRLAIAEERGFREELKMSVLAKIMLAERFAPELYDAMARGSANTGASEELAALEAVVANPSADLQTKSADGKEKVSATEASLPDWPNLEWAKQWAAIDPPLAENDLRPYVFVTRDRRSVFGAVTSLGELDELGAKLQGSPLQVKQAAAEIARLQSIEAEQVFDALRAKVRDTEDLTQEPAGVRGLAEVARQHPFLQRPLLSFVQDLPISKLGPWVVSGWASAFGETDVALDFAKTLKGWAEQDDNKQLKAAAAAAEKLSGKRKRP
ncbi:Qat anti-phage system ATPase QatA [Pseudoroseicyclus aestuarii]|uniref:Putative KAP-like P-loop ATPase n=1 Tax=Pseudoroseicyclus aestuarii TaxID=1795041 RepID=A0A318SM07_9RHOB|nr:Qat anti-phage system ATPase QatA [Pseudoroseicyclus aestuarii]PYE80582.1 putative KAP-like P-loop ATPase [Pseudoroseicyclus aestuarii]